MRCSLILFPRKPSNLTQSNHLFAEILKPSMATFSKQELVVEAFQAFKEARKLSTADYTASPDVSSH